MTTVALAESKIVPWRHQRAAVEFVGQLYTAGWHGAMVAAAMGTGKSAITVYLCAEQGFRNILILCPLRVVQVWRPQFRMHSSLPFVVVPLADSIANVRRKREEAERHIQLARTMNAPIVIVTNYESAWRQPFSDWALKQKWDLVVADEIHRCKAPGGKASRFLASLARAARYRLGLSGTPMPHSPLDVYAYFRFLDPSVFGTSFARFRNHYAEMGGYEGREVVGYRNLDELNRKFRSITFQVGKEVLDLPPETHIDFHCELGNEALEIYGSLERELVAAVRSGEVTAANALVRLLRLQQLTSGYVHTDDGSDVEIDSSKVALLTDVMEDIDHDDAVVVFCRFRHDLDVVHRVADQLGRGSCEISGRRDELASWQAGAAPILAAQIESGGVGVDLTRARYAIYYSLGFSLGSYQQSLARIHRPGQTRPVQYIHLLASGTVDEQVMTALGDRADVIRSVLGHMRSNQ